jgi:hypothetical protein
MRDRKIQRMVMKGEITNAEGQQMAAAKATKPTPSREEPISYRNSERYADPTAFQAMQNIVREQHRATPRAYPRTRVARYA